MTKRAGSARSEGASYRNDSSIGRHGNQAEIVKAVLPLPFPEGTLSTCRKGVAKFANGSKIVPAVRGDRTPLLIPSERWHVSGAGSDGASI